MKCEYCGGNLGLEDTCCPHCGRPNRLAQQHVRDMEQFSGEFAETKQKVYRTTRRFSGVATRAIVLAVLIVAIVVMFFFSANAYSLQAEWKRQDARKNAEVYVQQIDRMLVQGEYREAAGFVEAHGIHSWLEGYEAYQQILEALRQYNYAVQYLMNIRLDGRNDEYSFNEVEYFASALQSFYRVTDPEYYSYGKEIDHEKTNEVVEGMQENLNALMKTYLGLTDEEIREQETMTEARRTVLFQDKYEALYGHNVPEEDAVESGGYDNE